MKLGEVFITSAPYDRKLSKDGSISRIKKNLSCLLTRNQKISGQTIKEVDSIGLEQFIGRLEHLPHVSIDATKVESQGVDQLVDIVEQV